MLLGGYGGYLKCVQNVLQTGGSVVMCMMFGLGRDTVQHNTITNSSAKKSFVLKNKVIHLIFRIKGHVSCRNSFKAHKVVRVV